MRWTFTWSDPDAPASANSRTTGRLAVRIGDETVWKGVDFEWNWIELLEWLSNSWRWLVGEDGLPFDLLPSDFGHAKQVMSKQTDAEADFFWEFLQTHEFGESLRGAWSPAALVVWREGLVGHWLTTEDHYTEHWGHTRSTLERIGQQISDRLTPALGRDERADKARAAWNARSTVSASDLVATTGLAGSAADLIAALMQNKTLDVDAVANDELLAVAKMSASLPPSTVRSIVEHLLDIPRVDVGEVNDVSRRVLDAAALDDDDLPHEAALEIARAFREVAGISTEKAFDPEQWLLRAGVYVGSVDFGTPIVRAMAAWGAKHGPGVLLNAGHQRANSPSYTRADLAHEVCHLLVDRDAAVPAADLLAGHSDRAAEKRANAFAAEILMPRVEAVAEFEPVLTEADARRSVNRLTSRFVVSRSIVAWQVLNSSLQTPPDVRSTLKSMVTRRWFVGRGRS